MPPSRYVRSVTNYPYSTRRLQLPTGRKFINLLSLTFLGLSYCKVSSLSVETFANVSALEWLDLSYNKLKTVDINIIRAFPKLSALYLYGNRLQCDCQLQQVWRWCQDHDIESSSGETAPKCDTPSGVCHIYVLVYSTQQKLQSHTPC